MYQNQRPEEGAGFKFQYQQAQPLLRIRVHITVCTSPPNLLPGLDSKQMAKGYSQGTKVRDGWVHTGHRQFQNTEIKFAR